MICYKVCTHSREKSVCFQKNTMNIGLYSKHECLLGTWSSGAVFIPGKYSEDGCWLAGAGASDLRVAVCLASSRLVQRDTVRSRGYLQPGTLILLPLTLSLILYSVTLQFYNQPILFTLNSPT